MDETKQERIRREKEETTKTVIHETIRFGAAIGSWLDSDKRWHQQAAASCCRAIEETAMVEILSRCQRIDDNICHSCRRPKIETDVEKQST